MTVADTSWVRFLTSLALRCSVCVSSERRINKRYCTDSLRADYPHVGLFDVEDGRPWVARKRWGVSPVQISHARLLVGGTQNTSTADKDRFICYWYHTPNSGEGYVHGYPIEWDEAHLLIRLDPNWNYLTQSFIPGSDTRKVEANIERQFDWGKKIFQLYVDTKRTFPISYHMVGPRAADSMFYVERMEANA